MARSSRAFRTMLFGGFAESKPDTGEWVVRLSEDDARGFEILLHIIHGRVDRVPVDMVAGRENFRDDASSNQAIRDGSAFLYEVLRMADKYCILHLLRPWINRWLKPWREDEVCMGLFSGEVLWAAWMVGDETVVRKELGKATFSARYRGMAYKGRAWVKDQHGREHRLGAMPDGPLALIDGEGLGEVIVDARYSHIEHLANILVTLHTTAGYLVPKISEDDVGCFKMVVEENFRVVCERQKIRPAISPWDGDSLKAYKHTVPKLLATLKMVGRLLTQDAEGLECPLFDLLLEGDMAIDERTNDFRSEREKVCLTVDHESFLEHRREITGVESIEPLQDD
ncbi:hypothetical protein GE09DRAFT_1288957 [Coniochaeta sp. 2T2.1]|nr:hypothetical protein GE09DRAFT_1288957 [Coniochaeta sp. 2T2.1]